MLRAPRDMERCQEHLPTTANLLRGRDARPGASCQAAQLPKETPMKQSLTTPQKVVKLAFGVCVIFGYGAAMGAPAHATTTPGSLSSAATSSFSRVHDTDRDGMPNRWE